MRIDFRKTATIGTAALGLLALPSFAMAAGADDMRYRAGHADRDNEYGHGRDERGRSGGGFSEDRSIREFRERVRERHLGREDHERDARERDARARDERERDARAREVRERDARAREVRERDARARADRERDARAREDRERDARAREVRERDARAREIHESARERVAHHFDRQDRQPAFREPVREGPRHFFYGGGYPVRRVVFAGGFPGYGYGPVFRHRVGYGFGYGRPRVRFVRIYRARFVRYAW